LFIISLFPPVENFTFPTRRLKGLRFPDNGPGDFILFRNHIIDPLLQILTSEVEQSYYFRGPRGHGKTMFLQLIGQALVDKGETVTFVKNAGFLNNEIKEVDLKRLSASAPPGKRVYVLIDEVHENKSSPLWTYLLKGEHSFVIIGAGIPQLGSSPSFLVKYDPSFLDLTPADLDDRVVQYFLGIVPPDQQREHGLDARRARLALDWTLVFTGGHVYPFLQLEPIFFRIM
jgi:hypothetical protein